ncbi:MAG TPA: serine/threonine-protein kinase, partial [Thermomicrobiales bacterium]
MRDASPTLLLGRYRSEAVIGEGAFGRVVRAFDTRLKRPVAIKTLKRSLAQTDLGHFRQLEDRFVREAEAGARVGSHANLVTVYDLIEDDDRSLHLVLLYVPGGTIGERLAADGSFPLADALRLTADIARGLQAAHDAGIVHRDIKPANVFMATDGRAQVGDFGIAQLDHLSARTYAFVGHPGTPLYMSPEQSQQTGYVRPTSDQYSAGLVLFEMLHGQ